MILFWQISGAACSCLFRAAEQKLDESEQTVMQSNWLVEKLRDELRVVKAELAERTRLGKRYEISYADENFRLIHPGNSNQLSQIYNKSFCNSWKPTTSILGKCFFLSAEQQRNQALRNAEKLTVTFKEYKEDVSEKLRKVIQHRNLKLT